MAYYLGVMEPFDPLFSVPLLVYTIVSLFIKFPVFYGFKLYQRYWLYADINDLIAIIYASGITGMVLLLLTIAGGSQESLSMAAPPWQVPFLDGALTPLILTGVHFSPRIIAYYTGRARSRRKGNKRILVAGAGEAGKIAAYEIYHSRYLHKNLIGFIDDDPQKIGTIIHGVMVYGPMDQLPQLIERLRIQKVIIAMPSVPGSVIRRILDLCEPTGVETLTMPGLYELLNDTVKINALRPVKITDLLRRDPVDVDMVEVQALLAGKRVLVTGAGGSIGTELCTQIAACDPACLVALGHGENSLVALCDHIAELPHSSLPAFHPVVADVRDLPRLDGVFNRFKPEIVFHAAAHKHVPMLEDNVEDAVTNNITGTWNLVQICRKYDVSKFVLISTDKAVQPVNVMGMTKQVAEQIVQEAAAQTGRPYVSVRFGNVLGSRGSVIPLFESQIKEGGPVTVTHPEIDRYFMTIPEAVQLVLQAAALGQNGEVFILDMGEPVNITDLARDMIRLSGLQEGRDIHIRYTGLRPGERLHEKLFTEDENRTHTVHEKIFVAHHDPTPWQQLFAHEIQELQQLAASGKTDDLRRKLAALSNHIPSKSQSPHRETSVVDQAA